MHYVTPIKQLLPGLGPVSCCLNIFLFQYVRRIKGNFVFGAYSMALSAIFPRPAPLRKARRLLGGGPPLFMPVYIHVLPGGARSP